MLANRKGAILNVGSAAGNLPIPNNATYVFTKAGVNVFTEALHYELKGSGVSCTLLAPGPVRDAVIPEEEKSINPAQKSPSKRWQRINAVWFRVR